MIRMSNAEKTRVRSILSKLKEVYGTEPWNWHTSQSPFRVLIGTVLSQRTKDEKTDEASKALFLEYPSPRRIADAPVENLKNIIKSVNYYKTKAKRIKELCQVLLEKYSGEVPGSIDELLSLPGVGRKTASCVMVYGFKKPAIAVDTHVHRICNRTGIVHTKTANETERELWNIVPKEYILHLNELMVKHGQEICRPGKPLCFKCSIADLCKSEKKNLRP